MLENWDEVYSALQRRYRGAKLQMIDFGTRRMSLREQVGGRRAETVVLIQSVRGGRALPL